MNYRVWDGMGASSGNSSLRAVVSLEFLQVSFYGLSQGKQPRSVLFGENQPVPLSSLLVGLITLSSLELFSRLGHLAVVWILEVVRDPRFG